MYQNTFTIFLRRKGYTVIYCQTATHLQILDDNF